MKKYKNWDLIIYLIIGLTIFVMSEMIPFQPDEYNYSNFIWTDRRIQNITEIFKSQILMYKLWSGRVIVHFIIQILLFLGKNIYNIINSIVFVINIILIQKITKIEIKPLNILFVFICMWYFIPVFPETILWLSGSLNYMWPGLILLYFIYKQEDTKEKNNYFLIGISFLVGASQENTSLLLNAYLFYFILKDYFLNKRIEKDIFKRFCASLLGMIFLFGAPGNFKRASGGLKFMPQNWINITFANKKIFIIIFILLIVNIIVIKMKRIDKNDFNKALEYFLIGLVSLIPMILINEYPPRATYAAYLFFIISIVLLVKILKEKQKDFLIFLLILLALPNYFKVLHYYNVELRGQVERRKIEALDLSKGTINFITPIKMSEDESLKRQMLGHKEDILPNPYAIPNVYFSTYYSLDKVYGVSKDENILKISRLNDTEKNMEVFWNEGNGYNPKNRYTENSYVEPSKNNLTETEAYFVIPKNIRRLRIDIGSQPGIKGIKEIQIFNKGYDKKITSTELKKKIKNSNHIDKMYLENDYLILHSTGNDPFIEIEI